jgi:hypothetical protein
MGKYIALCPQLKTVSLAFEWGDCIEDGGSWPIRGEVLLECAKELVSICEAADVRLEDCLGQTYEEWRKDISS